jgi:hypothetical protein
MTTHFYDAVGLPAPEGDPHRVHVTTSDLPRLRGRLLAAGARVEDRGPTSLSFVDPAGVRVELLGQHLLPAPVAAIPPRPAPPRSAR